VGGGGLGGGLGGGGLGGGLGGGGLNVMLQQVRELLMMTSVDL
jgi:hypothetical protein